MAQWLWVSVWIYSSFSVSISELRITWYIVAMAVMMTLIFGNLSEHTHTCWDTQSTNWTAVAVANYPTGYPTVNLWYGISVTMRIHILTIYPRNWYKLSQNLMLEAGNFVLVILAWTAYKVWRSWQLTHPCTSSLIHTHVHKPMHTHRVRTSCHMVQWSAWVSIENTMLCPIIWTL